jgi:hypothetical protein
MNKEPMSRGESTRNDQIEADEAFGAIHQCVDKTINVKPCPGELVELAVATSNGRDA